MHKSRSPLLAFALLAAVAFHDLRAARAAQPAADIVPTEALVIRPVATYGRNAVHRDAVAALLVAGKWQAPKAGDELKVHGGAQQWEAAKFTKDGGLQHAALRGGYALVTI